MQGSNANAMSVRQRMLALARLVDLNCTAQGCSSSSDPHCTEDVEVCESLSLRGAEELASFILSDRPWREFCLLHAGWIPVLCAVGGVVWREWCCVGVGGVAWCGFEGWLVYLASFLLMLSQSFLPPTSFGPVAEPANARACAQLHRRKE